MSRLLAALGLWLYCTFRGPLSEATPREEQLASKLDQATVDKRHAEVAREALESELRIMKRDMDLLNEIIERERARVRMETEYFGGEWKRGR